MRIHKTTTIGDIWLAIGANALGNTINPRLALEYTRTALLGHNLVVFSSSCVHITPPIGSVRQNRFHNAVIGIRGSIAPAALLRLLKRIERSAGRRLGVRWGPRPLDIDILDFGGRIIGHPARMTRPGTLILPHPGIAARGFVLVPLAEVAPHWRHPILGVSAGTLLARKPGLRRGIVPATQPPGGLNPGRTQK